MLKKKPLVLLKHIFSQRLKYFTNPREKEKFKTYSDDENQLNLPNANKIIHNIKHKNIQEEDLPFVDNEDIHSPLISDEFTLNDDNFLNIEDDTSLNKLIDDYFNTNKTNFKGKLKININRSFKQLL